MDADDPDRSVGLDRLDHPVGVFVAEVGDELNRVFTRIRTWHKCPTLDFIVLTRARDPFCVIDDKRAKRVRVHAKTLSIENCSNVPITVRYKELGGVI